MIYILKHVQVVETTKQKLAYFETSKMYCTLTFTYHKAIIPFMQGQSLIVSNSSKKFYISCLRKGQSKNMARQVQDGNTYFKNCDFAQLGSPTIQTLMSPLRLIPSWVILWTPPKSIRRIALFISWWPKMVGHMLSTILLKKSGVFLILTTSSSSSSCQRDGSKYQCYNWYKWAATCRWLSI
jgi:hypothetical protein